ncbi:MAG: hypothetical protein AVO35_06695 [Candidatus Aegiribacteria sp. MLS_C]|nr:MAG: hypothetical protein AVO35_06695 [Candidatus Aegiribacteria sp. MLS_C]
MENYDSMCFGEDISSTVVMMKNILGEILHGLDISVDNPRDVYKKLNIDKKLGWKIYNVICEDDPFLAAQFVPGKAACRNFMKLCKKLGTSKKLLKRAREACQAFDEMVEKHADSRKEFDLMLLACSDKGRSKAFLSQQKAAFTAYSHLLGVQAATQLCTWVFCPSDDGLYHDIASIRGFVDFRRNRPNVPWLLEWAYFTDDENVPKSFVQVQPLEACPEGTENHMGVPFYYSFCSAPLPNVVSSRKCEGRVVHELEEAPIGNTEAMTCITAQVARSVFSSYRTREDRYREVLVRSRTPVERLVFDQIVHRDLIGPMDPELFVFGEFTGYDWARAAEFRNPNSCLPIEASIQKLGFGVRAMYSPYLPWYTEMMEDVFARLDWDPNLFRTYRVVIDYPVIPSTVNMRSLLPERE